MSATNAIMMQQTFRFLKPAIWVTAIPRIFYIMINLVPAFLTPEEQQKSFLFIRWTGLSSAFRPSFFQMLMVRHWAKAGRNSHPRERPGVSREGNKRREIIWGPTTKVKNQQESQALHSISFSNVKWFPNPEKKLYM